MCGLKKCLGRVLGCSGKAGAFASWSGDVCERTGLEGNSVTQRRFGGGGSSGGGVVVGPSSA